MTFHKSAVAVAGLCGALGVALSAIAAHRDTTGLLNTAAQMLLFHAPAFLGLAALPGNQLRKWALAALFAGVAVFSADLSVRSLFGWERLFAMAAPSGGMLMIGGWLMVGFSALRPDKAGS